MEQNFGELQFNKNYRNDLCAKEVALGQKLVIFAVLLNILVVGAVVAAPGFGISQQIGAVLVIALWIARVVAFVVGVYGVFKIGSGLDWSGLAKGFTFFLLLVPIINLVTLLVVNGRATSFLKKSGYKVGLAGAYK